MSQIYLDHAATTPLHESVIKKMIRTMETSYGNPSSIHSFGREGRRLIDQARTSLARSINALEKEVIFTSGGTEANNLALFGTAHANSSKGRHIITTAIEHHSVIHVCEQLEKEGFEITYLSVNNEGKICLNELKNSLRDDTIIVSIMYANNEVGTIQPIYEIGQLLRDHQAFFHTDAVQAYGIEEIDVNKCNIDLMSASAHKIGGPKGSGFLYIRDRTPCLARQFGGVQERKLRPGTESVFNIVGFEEAFKETIKDRDDNIKTYRMWKELFIDNLKEANISFAINGSLVEESSLPHILNISFSNVKVETLLVNLDMDKIAASSGSACSAGSILPSHVLVACFGQDSERVHNSVRFSFGLANTTEQIDEGSKKVAQIVSRLVKK